MLRKLRIKFVIICMSMVTAVVLIGLIIIVAYNAQQQYESADRRLSMAIEQTSNYVGSQLSYYNSLYGFMLDFEPSNPDSQKNPDNNQPNNNQPNKKPDDKAQDNNNGKDRFSPPEIGREGDSELQATPVATYILTSDNNLVVPGGGISTAVVPDDILENATKQVAKANFGMRELPDLSLLYKKDEVNDVVYVAFADISIVSGWKILAASLIPIGLLLLVLFLIVSIIASRIAVRPVAEAWEGQQRFVADASHDLKTPLTVIMANNSILKSKPESKISDQIQWIESTDEESNRMLHLINNMLTLAKIDDPKVVKKEKIKSFSKFDFSELVEQISLQFESVAFEKNAVLATNIETNMEIFANKENIRKMVGTLLENACKYAEGEETIRVNLKRDSGSAVLSIKNTNSYISEEDLPHIFERFYRSDKARTSTNEKQGHGLGLAIALSTAEECGGSLKAVSSKNNGTTFIATIPIAKK